MYTLNCKGRLLALDKPHVMGIINITPDSFYARSRHQAIDEILAQADAMLREGATMLDIGAQSTRPTSDFLDADTEWSRLAELLPALCRSFPDAIFSIDTFHHQVAINAVNAGVSIVNDVSGGWLDDKMIASVGLLGVPYVCMHMKGTPQTMRTMTKYENIMAEISSYFIERIEACKNAGIRDVILDPGIGFAKSIEQNFEVLKQMTLLRILDKPLLLGVSRKSMIARTLDVTTDAALNGTTVLNTIGILNGANILRVHDVKEAVQVVRLMEKLQLPS